MLIFKYQYSIITFYRKCRSLLFLRKCTHFQLCIFFKATSGGNEGRYTQERGMLAFYEVCQEFRNGGWTREKDEVGSPYMYKKDQWIGYDDTEYISLKVRPLT